MANSPQSPPPPETTCAAPAGLIAPKPGATAPDRKRNAARLIALVLCWAIPIVLMGGTLTFFARTVGRVAASARVFPLDSYFYQSFASNIQRGLGPRTDWPQGPQNKYFPGFAYWWALFMPRGAHPDDAIRAYGVAQTVLVALLLPFLIAIGRAVWRDWPVALAFAALTSAAPVLLKWAFVPLAELLATVCIAAFAAAALALLESSPRDAGFPPARAAAWKRRALLAAMAAAGAAGLATRIETAYFLAGLMLALVATRRLRWSAAVLVLGVAALPLAVWQVWATRTFHEASYYMGEGSKAFRWADYVDLFFFHMMYFVRVQNVLSASIAENCAMLAAHTLFVFALLIALRGYGGRTACLAAWMSLGYWALHSLWYYKTDRYALPLYPLGFLVFVEGTGRLFNFRRGWLARGGRVALALFCLVLTPVFWGHASDNVWRMIGVMNQGQRVVRNQAAIAAAMAREQAALGKPPVFLTNLSLPDARRLPGAVWFDEVFQRDPCMDRLAPLFPPGSPRAFLAAQGVTHLALAQPAAQWLERNGKGLSAVPVYEDDMVWIARIGGPPAAR